MIGIIGLCVQIPNKERIRKKQNTMVGSDFLSGVIRHLFQHKQDQ